MSTSCTTKALKIGLLLLIAFWVSILYWPGLHGPYFLDDLQTIDLKQPKELNWSELLSKSLQNHTGPVGRPISVLSLSLNYVLLGGEPFYFKLINLILHVVTGFSIGWFVYLLILSLYPSKLKKAKLVAMFCAIIWLIHPLQVSTVLYAVQRMTQLSALFTLLGLISYLYGRLTHKKYFYLGSLIFFPLAILSKETGFLFVFYLFS